MSAYYETLPTSGAWWHLQLVSPTRACALESSLQPGGACPTTVSIYRGQSLRLLLCWMAAGDRWAAPGARRRTARRYLLAGQDSAITTSGYVLSGGEGV